MIVFYVNINKKFEFVSPTLGAKASRVSTAAKTSTSARTTPARWEAPASTATAASNASAPPTLPACCVNSRSYSRLRHKCRRLVNLFFSAYFLPTFRLVKLLFSVNFEKFFSNH